MMVVKQVTSSTPAARPARRVGVAEAKSKFSQLLRDAALAPAIIHSRGRDLVVVLAVAEYEALLSHRAVTGGAALLGRIEALKQASGGGEDFTPARLEFAPVDPFSERAR